MRRRRYLRNAVVTPLLVGIGGCQSDSPEEDEIVGRGTLTIENRSEGSVRANYGLLEAGQSIEQATLERVELGVEGDSFEAVYRDVTGGPYRFVVAVPDRDGSPADQQWNLAECQEYGVTARIFPDALNVSASLCVHRL